MEALIAGLAEKDAELLINGIPATLSALAKHIKERGEAVSRSVYPVSSQRGGALQSGQDDDDRTRPRQLLSPHGASSA